MPPHSSTQTAALVRSPASSPRQGRRPAANGSKSPSTRSPSSSRAHKGSPKSSPRKSPMSARACHDRARSPSPLRNLPKQPLKPRSLFPAKDLRLNVVMSPPAIRKQVMLEIANRRPTDPNESPVLSRRAHSPAFAPVATASINHAAPSPLKLASPAVFSPAVFSPHLVSSPVRPLPTAPSKSTSSPVRPLPAAPKSTTPSLPPTPRVLASPLFLSPQVPRAEKVVGGGDKAPVNVLKSSFGVSKSPMMRDYLLNAISAKSDSPPIHSPGGGRHNRSPSYPLPSPTSSPRSRKLSEPVPVQVDHLSRKTQLTGSSDTISMPYNISHTHIDVSTLSLMVQGNNLDLLSNGSIPVYEKSGNLHKLAGSTWKERWVVCKKSVLSYYNNKDSKKPRGQIYLTDCECSRDRDSKRPFSLKLLHLPTKKTYEFSASTSELFDEWVRVMLGAGAADKDLLKMEQDLKEREKKESEARAAKELKKKEDEYVKQKMRKRSTLKLTNKDMTSTAMEGCKCEFTVKIAGSAKEEKKEEEREREEFEIEVEFDDQQWTVFRSYDKIVKLYESATKLKFVKGMCPPRKAPSSLSEAEFREVQRESVQKLLDMLARSRQCVFAFSSTKQVFLRFIAPVGWHDIKADHFVMPFQLVY